MPPKGAAYVEELTPEEDGRGGGNVGCDKPQTFDKNIKSRDCELTAIHTLSFWLIIGEHCSIYTSHSYERLVS